jgi:ATP-dependent DNA helicase RecG
MTDFKFTAIEYLKGVGPARAELLNKELDIFRFADLLKHFPHRYEDRSVIHTTKEITRELPFIQLKGTISNPVVQGVGKGKRLTATFRDSTGTIELVWFKGVAYMDKYLKLGVTYLCFGKPNYFNGKYNIVHPELTEFELGKDSNLLGLHPIYPLTEKLKNRKIESRNLWTWARAIVQNPAFKMVEIIPESILRKYNLITREQAYKLIHNPKNYGDINEAQRRIKFEEFFLLQFKMARIMKGRKLNANGIIFKEVGENFNAFFKNNLPFELTNAQKRVIKEIRKDLGSGFQMNRLLQGDVGSGKTVVALMVALLAMDNGYQTCIMAPTEILASQHFISITNMLEGLGINVKLLMGSTTKSARKAIHAELQSGELNILIGTHALIEDEVVFQNLGLVIIDEQHRFGVAQRARLWKKNNVPPHVLVMTATPIPRTLAMTVYGDLDTSIIDELPAGRKPVRTVHRTDNDRFKIMHFAKEEIEKSRQIYFVFPLIEESAKLQLKDLMNGYDMVVDHFPLPTYQIGLLHGRLKPAEKEAVMNDFKNGRTNILIATTVIEVGVDVPNASVMIIENAERFGLSQLHQLRGRVGRGAEQSYCILVSSHKLSSNGRERLKAMVETNNGFEIAAKDLKLRGPGNIEGTQQSGILDLQLADIVKDDDILNEARQASMELVEDDPDLDKEANATLKLYLQHMASGKKWSRIS